MRPVNYKACSSDVAHDEWVGKVTNFTTEVTDEDFVQARMLWNVLGKREGQQDSFIANVGGHLKTAVMRVQKETIRKSP